MALTMSNTLKILKPGKSWCQVVAYYCSQHMHPPNSAGKFRDESGLQLETLKEDKLMTRAIENTEIKQAQKLRLTPDQPANPKLLKVAIIGTYNSGKSTLTNRLMGWKVSPVSSKIHTTQNNVLAVHTEGDTQIIFKDTPGIIRGSRISTRHREKLKKSIREDPKKSLIDANLICVLVDASDRWDTEYLDESLYHLLRKNKHIPSVLVLNKADKVKQKDRLLHVTRTLTMETVGGNKFSVGRKPHPDERPWKDPVLKLNSDKKIKKPKSKMEALFDKVDHIRLARQQESNLYDENLQREGHQSQPESYHDDHQGHQPQGHQSPPESYHDDHQGHQPQGHQSPPESYHDDHQGHQSQGHQGRPESFNEGRQEHQPQGHQTADQGHRNHAGHQGQFEGQQEHRLESYHKSQPESYREGHQGHGEGHEGSNLEGQDVSTVQTTERTDIPEYALQKPIPCGWDSFDRVFMTSALHNIGVDEVKEYMLAHALPADWWYHSAVVTDQNPYRLAEKIVWEKMLEHLHQEIPYQYFPRMKEWVASEEVLKITMKIDIFRPRHLKKAIGYQGSVIQQIWKDSHQALMDVFRCDIILDLDMCSEDRKGKDKRAARYIDVDAIRTVQQLIEDDKATSETDDWVSDSDGDDWSDGSS